MRSRTLSALVALCLSAPAALHAAAASLPFVEDDYPRALAAARARHVPLFLEAWAPWCHSCRSMRAFVYPDPRLARYAERFVWLAIDTEKAGNAEVVARYPVGAWPTMYVIDPASQTVARRWTGSATVEQLTRFLDEALAATPAPDPWTTALARADRLYGAGDWAGAASAFGAAIARAPRDWPALPRAADAQVFALSRAGQEAECARVARTLLPRLAGAPAAAAVAAAGLDCALALDAGAPGRAAAVADEWIALLERSAASAPNPDARAVFDSHRLTAYLEIGAPERALPMLEASERDLPGDYNPPARLAVALHAMKDDARALAASDRALGRAYGPRRLGILRTRAQIQLALGDRAAAQATLEQAIREGEALAAAQRSERQLAALRRELEALRAPAPGAS